MSEGAVKAVNEPVEITTNGSYQALVGGIADVIDDAKRAAVRSVNTAMTAAYWLVGRHIVEFEQGGKERADYGAALLHRLAADLVQHLGRGFSRPNLQQMRLFYLAYPPHQICQTLSGKSQRLARPPIRQTPSGKFDAHELGPQDLVAAFPLPWSAYVRLLSVKNPNARTFYETEALRGGWSVRQLDVRSTRSSMSVPPSPRTRRRCSNRASKRNPRTPCCRSKPSRTHSYWSS